MELIHSNQIILFASHFQVFPNIYNMSILFRFHYNYILSVSVVFRTPVPGFPDPEFPDPGLGGSIFYSSGIILLGIYIG